jgi:deazaflavin-dependent oxidoreductase (nitroreductase family)
VVNAKDLVARTVTSMHEMIFKASSGRLLGSFGGMPVLILTTTGRKSGRKRSTMLTSPVRDGDRLVIVASYGGDDRHPAWFLNLRDNPDVTVTMGGRTRPMRARVATDEEKAELWPQVIAAYKGYEGYQQRTSREIPLVVLVPAPASSVG